ncbi:MAG: ABC transporter substrate-binding protein [Zoogloea sp.]|nr:ABC transporter substrate-binding protein [Zoogloea sp.]
MKKLFALLLALSCSFGGAAAFAQEEAPDAMVKGVSNDVLAIVRQDKAIQSGDSRKAVELVEVKVLPHFDFSRMTQLAVGRNWRSATPDQKAALTQEFKLLLVRTYSNALTKYRNQTIDYKPLKMKADDTDVTVRTEVKQPGAKPVQIDYGLEKVGSTWKVYDVLVGGVSLVTNYREDFNQEISRGGIDGLLKSLRDKNRQLESGSGTKK